MNTDRTRPARDRKRTLKTLWVATLCGIVVVSLQPLFPEMVQRLHHVQYDYLLRSRPSSPSVDDRLVLFGIDDRTIEELQHYPVPRASHAQLTAGLGNAGASLVAWDMIFDLPDPSDDAFAAAMKDIPTILAVGTIPVTKGVVAGEDALPRVLERFGVPRLEAGAAGDLPPYAIRLVMNRTLLEGVAAAGHASAFLDADGVCRRVPMVVAVGDRILPSLSLAMAMKLRGVEPDDFHFPEPGVLRIGARSLSTPVDIPVDSQARMLVNCIPRWENAIDRRSYAMQLQSLADFPEDMAEGLSGKAVLVGETQSAGGDFIPTALERSTPGMVVVAQLVNTILTEQFITIAPAMSVRLLAFLLALATGLAFLFRKPLFLLLVILPMIGLLLALPAILMFHHDHFMPVTEPLVAVLVTAGTLLSMRLVGEHRRSTRSASLLAKFVSPAILDELDATDYRDKQLSVSRRELSILFVDVVGFTERTSHSEPEELAAFLSAYYDTALSVIHGQGGTLDKVYGDGVLAYFGAPRPLDDKECCAVDAALLLAKGAAELSDTLAGGGHGALSIRCGIATDYVALGYFGGDKYAAYTVIGRAVNLAARLQQHAAPGDILVDRHTAARLGDRFTTEPTGTLSLKGIDRPTEVWRVAGRR